MFYISNHIFLRSINSSPSVHYLCGLFFLFLIFCSTIIYGVTDTTLKKQQYDLNDPRNPDCPCHKYQKLADEEYSRKNLQTDTGNSYRDFQINNEISGDNVEKQIQDGERNVQIDIKAVDNTGNSSTTVEYHVRKKTLRKHQHKKDRLITKMRFRFYKMYKKMWEIKVHPNNCLCYKWH